MCYLAFNYVYLGHSDVSELCVCLVVSSHYLDIIAYCTHMCHFGEIIRALVNSKSWYWLMVLIDTYYVSKLTSLPL